MTSMAEHEAFTAWSEEHGVEINGIAPAKLPGRGLGMVAQRPIKKGEILVSVPAKLLVTTASPLVRKYKLPSHCAPHGQLAAALTLSHDELDEGQKIWRATWPTRDDFQTTPLLWSAELQALLPEHAKQLLQKQKEKYRKDMGNLDNVIPQPKREVFLYYWLLVNSRCFYWVIPSPKRRRGPRPPKLAPDDCMALCPFADYFNHADHGCDFATNARKGWITCDRDYNEGEEVYVSYGNHNNDMLLAEYGFILEQNCWDEVMLDEAIMPRLSASQKELLEEYGFLGNYVLDNDQICHRSQAVLRVLLQPKGKSVRFLRGDDDGESEQGLVDELRVKVLREYKSTIEKRLETIMGMDGESMSQRVILTDRWKQILGLLEKRCVSGG
ncbi:SET domain-containing protein [Aulographum hederae CBS 113979]|uniref:SET domain-containing protein n=1 Tax=Aulographum hederae CBS 113979 TaxID=1176131 RepID=A0A6G1HDN5_9PEZI|nr:SET domain-containing protein [Aulographum hederae CBS 113979]